MVTDYFRSATCKARVLSRETKDDAAMYWSVDAIGVSRFVFRLDEKYQSIMILAYYDGYTQVEISKKLGIPFGTLKTRMRVGLSMLKSYCFDRVSEKSRDTYSKAV